MPRGGHNKKPTNLKVLQGTDRPDRMPENEPKPRPIAGDMPPGMDYYAKKCWEKNAPLLERLGLLTEADIDMFRAYCEAFARYRRAQKRMSDHVGNLSPVDDADIIRKLEISVEKAEHSMRLLAGEFGLTPSARGRLSVEAPGGDDLDDFIQQRGG